MTQARSTRRPGTCSSTASPCSRSGCRIHPRSALPHPTAKTPGQRSQAPAPASFATTPSGRQAGLDEQLIAVGEQLDAAPAHGLQLWLALAGVDNDLSQQPLLDQVVNTFKGHPGLGAWKGSDEPAHAHVPAAGCVAVYHHLKQLDPHHPVVIIEAPRGPGPTPHSPDKPLTIAAVRPYAAACDVHGIDIYPIPPGAHAGGPPVNTDISVVGDMTSLIAKASTQKAIWTTLQIAWTGTLPPHPIVFPTLQQARFMAYDAIINGARGLFFFGGQLKAAMNAADQARGWNWTYWNNVAAPVARRAQRPRPPPRPARTARRAHDHRQRPRHRPQRPHRRRHPLPDRGQKEPLGQRPHPLQRPPSRNQTTGRCSPTPEATPHDPVTVTRGAFTDPSPFAPHNARVYRFPG